jgi:hypothetical protein
VADGAGEGNRLGPTDRLCETLVSWRLLVGRAFALASHRSYSTTSEEPPLSHFNNYGDNPLLWSTQRSCGRNGQRASRRPDGCYATDNQNDSGGY